MKRLLLLWLAFAGMNMFGQEFVRIRNASQSGNHIVKMGVGDQQLTAPNALNLDYISGGVRLSWTDNSNNETGFEIFENVSGSAYTLLATTLQDVTTYDDLVDYSGMSVNYRIRAKRSWYYSDFSNVIDLINPKPTGLSLTLISGGVKIDWTDNTSGVYQTEIWVQNDGGTSTLLYTINAGTVTKNDNTVTPVDSRYYKLRAKNGAVYSVFTPEVSIAMLGQELIDQTQWYLGASYWTLNYQANWSSDGTQLTSNGSGGLLRRASWQFVSGAKYRTIVTGTNISGLLYTPYDGAGFPSSLQQNQTIVVTYYLADSNGNLTLYSNSFNGTLTGLSVKQILYP